MSRTSWGARKRPLHRSKPGEQPYKTDSELEEELDQLDARKVQTMPGYTLAQYKPYISKDLDAYDQLPAAVRSIARQTLYNWPAAMYWTLLQSYRDVKAIEAAVARQDLAWRRQEESTRGLTSSK